MSVVTPLNINKLASASDPRKALQAAIGSAIDKIDVFGSQVLVATYIAPEKIGSIYMPEKAKEESLWQGSVGLVLKKGPWAFVDDPENHIMWKGQTVQIGDWVLFRFSDAWEQHFNGTSVRFVDDRNIRGKLDDPGLISPRQVYV